MLQSATLFGNKITKHVAREWYVAMLAALMAVITMITIMQLQLQLAKYARCENYRGEYTTHANRGEKRVAPQEIEL